MAERKPHPRKYHEPGRNVYVSLETYDPTTYGKKHRGSIVLKRWSVSEVRDIIIEAFTARQQLRGDADPVARWADELKKETPCREPGNRKGRSGSPTS